MFKPIPIAAALILVCAASALAAGDSIMTRIDPQRLAQLVAQEGFAVADASVGGDQNVIQIKMNGLRVLLFVSKTGNNLQAYAGFRNPTMDLKGVNHWNKSMRFCRAYLTDNGSAALEADLDLDGGVSEEAVIEFLKTYARCLGKFNDAVFERPPTQQSQPPAPSTDAPPAPSAATAPAAPPRPVGTRPLSHPSGGAKVVKRR